MNPQGPYPPRPPYSQPPRPPMPPQYGPPGYPPPMWGRVPQPPMPLFGVALVALGGLLGFLQGVLPWIDTGFSSVTGFGLAAAIETAGGDPGFTRFAVWGAAMGGLALIALAGVGFAKRDNPTWASATVSILSGLIALGCIVDFVRLASRGFMDYAMIGAWFYLLSGIVALIGAIGWGSRKF